MSRAYPEHARHCSCPRIPTDLWERLRANPILSASPQMLAEVHRVLTGSPYPHGGSAHRSRILAQVTIPDAQGHQHWLGHRPRYGQPRVQFDSLTLPITKWLWLWAGPDRSLPLDSDQPLKRLCHDPE